MVSNAVYLVWASGEVQPFNDPSTLNKRTEDGIAIGTRKVAEPVN